MASTNLYIENYDPAVRFADGLKTKLPVTLSGTAATLAVGGTSTFTGVATFTAAPVFTGGVPSGAVLRTVTNSAAAGATVVLTAAQSGQTFNNASSSGTPSWTLPTAANGLWYTFTVSDVTAGFTVTGGTIRAKASATGATITGTTLTHTQGTAVVGDTITLVCDGTVWRMVAQAGIFAAA